MWSRSENDDFESLMLLLFPCGIQWILVDSGGFHAEPKFAIS